MSTQTFQTTVAVGRDGRVIVSVPFDPDQTWGRKPRHHVNGTLAGMGLRAVIEKVEEGHRFVLGPAWARGCRIDDGQQVMVELTPEGPQRDDLEPDIAAALDAEPKAGEFFDALAQFYRNAYLTWIRATKRSPEKRAERIAEVVRLLRAGVKQRPGT